MSIRFRHRLSGRLVTQVAERPVFGSYQLIVPEGVGFLNGQPLRHGDYLLADAAQRWRVLDPERDGHTQGTMAEALRPDPLMQHSLTELDRELEQVAAVGTNWTPWLETPPLMPGMSDRIKVLPIERLIHEKLRYLKEVCRRPRMQLRVEIEPVSVSRARRIPPSATEYLSAHTEDWDRPTLQGVRPKRVLSCLADDEWNIYENRVAVRLVDMTLQHVVKRLNEVRRLERVFQEASDFTQASEGVSWRVGRRVYALWGQLEGTNEGQRRAGETLAFLEHLRHELLGLMDSPLYRAIPRRVTVAPSLKPTNILRNDQHYRHVAALWREVARGTLAQTKPPRQWHEENQALCRAYERFCLLLVCRALNLMGFRTPREPLPLREGPAVHWSLPEGEILSLTWHDSGEIRLTLPDAGAFVFIPIPASLGAGTEESATTALETLDAEQPDNPLEMRVALYPGTARECVAWSAPIARRLNALAHELKPQNVGWSHLPASPLDLLSMERVMRAIQWWTLVHRFSAYPPRIDVRHSAVESLLGDANWIERKDSLVLRRLPDARERLTAVERFRLRKQQLAGMGRAHQGERQALEELEACVLGDETVAMRLLRRLLHCPVCGTEAESRKFSDLDGGCFRCTCSSCDSAWGTLSCGDCGEAYPMLTLGGSSTAKRIHQEAGWLDRAYGKDVLAVPHPDADGRYICSACGTA